MTIRGQLEKLYATADRWAAFGTPQQRRKACIDAIELCRAFPDDPLCGAELLTATMTQWGGGQLAWSCRDFEIRATTEGRGNFEVTSRYMPLGINGETYYFGCDASDLAAELAAFVRAVADASRESMERT